MPYKNPEDRKRHLKRWRENNPDYHKKYWKKHGKKYTKYALGREQRYKSNISNKIKVSARNKVYYALKTGKLIKPNRCEKCSTIARLEADHRDYSKPLDVQWLCKPCHQWFTTNLTV